jgi:SSS family solute:Na+ symporter
LVTSVWVSLIAVLAYVGAFAALIWRSPRAVAIDDAIVGGRALSAGALTMTLAAAWVGAATLFDAGPATAGLPALWRSAGLWLGILLLAIIAARIRHDECRTVPEWLGARYGQSARAGAAVALVAACVTLAAFQFLAAGRILQILSGAPGAIGALAAAVGCTSVVAAGGVRSTAWLDRLNVGLIAGAFALGCVYVASSGEAAAAMTRLQPEQQTIFGSIPPGKAIALMAATALLVLCDPGTFQKIASSAHERTATLAAFGWLCVAILLETVILTLTTVVTASNPSAGGAAGFMSLVASGSLPAPVALPLVAAGLAIVMSAGTTFVLAAASSLTIDLMAGRIRGVDPATGFRGSAAALGIGALIMAVVVPRSLEHALSLCSIYAAAVTPALLAGLLFGPIPRAAGLASMFTGAVAAIIWETAGAIHGAPPAGIAALPAALAASSATLLALARTSPKSRR